MIDFLRAAVQARLNCVVSGGTGSGKTTFLNVFRRFCPTANASSRSKTPPSFCSTKSHVVRLESRPPNIEGTGEIRIRDLFRNALRMRPDRIIIGECRGAEALDMLQAMNTGHDGSLTTIHANSPRDALSRIETMVLMAGFDLPVRAIREQIASAIDLVVHTARLRDGTRKVIGVSEVVGMEGDIVTMQEIMRFAQRGVDDDNKVVGDFDIRAFSRTACAASPSTAFRTMRRRWRNSRRRRRHGKRARPRRDLRRRVGDRHSRLLLVLGLGQRRATAKAYGLADLLDRAGITMKPQEIVLTVLALSRSLWISLVLLLHPSLARCCADRCRSCLRLRAQCILTAASTSGSAAGSRPLSRSSNRHCA